MLNSVQQKPLTARPPGLQSAVCRQASEPGLTSNCDVGDLRRPERPLVADSLGQSSPFQQRCGSCHAEPLQSPAGFELHQILHCTATGTRTEQNLFLHYFPSQNPSYYRLQFLLYSSHTTKYSVIFLYCTLHFYTFLFTFVL